MKKKKYEKPTCYVYKIGTVSKIMVGSPNPDYWGHIPGQPTDGKQMA